MLGISAGYRLHVGNTCKVHGAGGEEVFILAVDQPEGVHVPFALDLHASRARPNVPLSKLCVLQQQGLIKALGALDRAGL